MRSDIMDHLIIEIAFSANNEDWEWRLWTAHRAQGRYCNAW